MPKRGKDKPKGRPRTGQSGPKIVAKVLKIGTGSKGGNGHGGKRPGAGRPTKRERARMDSDREKIVEVRRRAATFADEAWTRLERIARTRSGGDPQIMAVVLRAVSTALTKAGLGDKVTVEHKGGPPVIVSFGDAGGLPRPDADVDGLPPEDDPEEQG